MSLFGALEGGLALEAGTLSSGILPLDASRRYDPCLYTVHWSLANELRRGNTAGILAALAVFDEVLVDPYADQATTIVQLDGSIADASVLEFLCGPEGARGPNGEVPSMHTVPDERFQATARTIRAAISLISSLDPALGEEIANYVAYIKPFSGTVVRGITSVRAFGCIFIRVPDGDPEPDEAVLYFVDHLTHEVSHLHLHALMNLDPLVTNSDDEVFPAPIRKDNRPLYGIYHATFVLSRIVRILGRLKKSRRSSRVEAAFAEAVGRYHKGYDTVAKYGQLTPLGRRVFEATRQVTELP